MGIGNDPYSHGLILDCILCFGTSIFVFMPNLGLPNLLLIISFSLSAQLSKMFQCLYKDTVVSAYVPGVITCTNSLLVLYFFLASLLNILMSLLDAHLTCPPLGTVVLTLFRGKFSSKVHVLSIT